MAERSEVASEIAGLFGDGGATVLSEADRGDTWNEVLAGLSPKLLQGEVFGPHPAGEFWLARLRDHWARSGELRPAIAATRGLIRRRSARLGREHPDTLLEVGAMGALADRGGKGDAAKRLLEESWQGLRSVAGGRDIRVAVVAEHVGMHYLKDGKEHEAQLALEQAWRIRSEAAPGTQGGAAGYLGDLHVSKGRFEKGIPLLQEAYELMRERYGPLHSRTQARATSLARALATVERFDEAEPVLRDLHAHAMKTGDKERMAETGFQLGIGLYRLKREEEGYRTIEESIKLTRKLGDPHPALAGRLALWSHILRGRRHFDEAEGTLKEAVEADRRLYGDDSADVAVRYLELAQFLDSLGRSDEAMGWVDPAYNLLRGTLGDEHPLTFRAAMGLADLLLKRAEHLLELRDKDAVRELQAYATSLYPVLGPNEATLVRIRELDTR